jgi:hypothetical protein
MPLRDQRILLVLAALSMALAVAQSAFGLSPDVLLAVPALLIFLPLIAGRYVGEDGLARLAARRRWTPARRGEPARGRALRALRIVPRGARLIAASLAERGPPAPLPAR